MKFIITESQTNLLSLERQSDIMYKLLQSLYPNNYIDDSSDYMDNGNDSSVYSDEDSEQLLFFYKWDEKEFYVGINFMEEFYNLTKLDIFNYNLIKQQDRERFTELIKVFAKRHYGWNVDKVWFHWY